MPDVQLCLFGKPSILCDGRTVELVSNKAIALLSFLSVTPAPQSREQLIGLLWAESTTEAARKNLRNTLWTLRRVLGEDVIISDGDHLSLHQDIQVDVRAFEHLVHGQPVVEPHTTPTSPASSLVQRADTPPAAPVHPEVLPRNSEWYFALTQRYQSALHLYRGPFLDGLVLPDAVAWELWLTTERERWHQSVMHLLEQLVDLWQSMGNWSEVIATARRALLYDNLHEPMYRALIAAHARLGERADALRQYNTLRTLLERELGVQPLPETEQLRTAILNGTLGPQNTTLPILPGRPERPPPVMGEYFLPPFIGRQSECATLDEVLQYVWHRQAQIVLITGEIGIGKSRLWREWSSRQPDTVTILEARCLEATRTLPFVPIVELLRNPQSVQRIFGPDSPVAPIWLSEVRRLLPELPAHRADGPVFTSLPPEAERSRLFEALVQSLRVFDAAPLVLFIDDLHWSDHATLDCLAYLMNRLSHQALLLVATYRPEDASAELVHLVAGWIRTGLAQRLSLPRLSPEETAQLVATLVPDPALAQRIQSQGAGNPYFLIELSRAPDSAVPPMLAELIRARLERLPEQSRQVLQAAAVLEPDFSFPLLRRTSGRSEEETLDALDTLIAAAVLVESGSTYAFAHSLVAAVVRDGLSQARRAFLHARAARVLEEFSAGRLSPLAGRLMTHYLEAGDLQEAAHYAELAAEHALTLAAAAEAVECSQLALKLAPTPARYIVLGRALERQGNLSGARTAYETAIELSDQAGDPRSTAQACLELSEMLLAAGPIEEVIAWAERSLTYPEVEADPTLLALAHFLLGAAGLRAGRAIAEAEAHLTTAARIMREHHLPDIAPRTRFELGNILAQRNDLSGAQACFREAAALAQQSGNQLMEILSYNNAAYYAVLAGDLDLAYHNFVQGMALAEKYAYGIAYQWLYSTRGEIALAEGQWDTAEQWFRRGLAEAERHHNAAQVAGYQANLALVARERGNLDEAIALLEAAREAAATLNEQHLQTQADLWLTELYAQRGELAVAHKFLTHAETRLVDSDRTYLQVWAQRLRQNHFGSKG